MIRWMAIRCLLLLSVVLGLHGPAPSVAAADGRPESVVDVSSFLPEGFVRDGSVSYQAEIQQALDHAARVGRAVRFPSSVFLLTNASGLRLHSNCAIYLEGAELVLSENLRADGQAFLARDVCNVTVIGGTITGRRDKWPDSVNLAGIRIHGNCRQIRIRDVRFRDLSSNAIGVFGHSQLRPISDVRVENVTASRCCNKYTDYLDKSPGPAKGSTREDQGTIAFYFVDDFVVSACTLRDSRSDGTHFYRCRDGRFRDNKVTGSKMGGYFVETSTRILATNNIILANGSRGVTIERGSKDCTLVGNVIADSGREGLWAPESIGLIVSDNIFRHNGRKNDGDLDGEIMINKSAHDPSMTPRAENYLVTGNLFETTKHQSAAVRILDHSHGIVFMGNSLRGPVRTILVGNERDDLRDVVVERNVGAVILRR